MKREETAWRLTKGDWKRNKNFERYQNCVEEMLRQTNTEYAPWNLIEATDKRYAAVKIYTAVIESMKKQLARYKHPGKGEIAIRFDAGGKTEIDVVRSGFEPELLQRSI